MRAAGGPAKLRYTIVSYSGEDADHPVRELLYHSPQTRGWQSPRFCKYPQEIVLKLEAPSKVQQLQILSHEYKIATKVEVYVASPEPSEDINKTPFKRLGYVTFDSNERTNLQARELKSVHFTIQATYVRLLVHRCHVNKLNIYNQVGIIGLNLIGEMAGRGPEVPPGGYLQLHPPVSKEVTYYNQAAADMADINLDIHVDTVTASKIRELARAKDMAVANEDYDEAKRLKASIDRLKVVGQKIAQLEARKRAAVEREDYDTAKLIKADIDKLRTAGDTAAISSDQFAPKPARNATDVMTRVLSKGHGGVQGDGTAGGHSLDDVPVRGMQGDGTGGGLGTGGGADGGLGASQDQGSPTAGGYDMGGGGLTYDDQGMMLEPEGSYGRSSYNNKHLAYDERPAQGRGRYTPSEEAMAEASLLGGGTRPAAGPAESDIPPPDGWPADLPAPEQLTGASGKDAEPIEELAGEYCARAAFSKNWQLREAALNYLMAQIKNGTLVSKSGSFKVLASLVKRLMKDKVANVFLTSLNAFQQLIDGYAASVGPRDVQSVSEGCIPLLIEKLGDANARLREASRESIMFIAGLRDAGLKSSTHLFVKPIKNQNAWRLILGVLGLLQDLIPLVGIGKSGAGDGFDLAELMDFVGKSYNNSNADVRSMAVKVTKEVHELVGAVIRKYLPKDINSKIKEQLDAVLGGGDAGGAGAMTAAATHSPPAPAPRTAARTSAAASGAKAAPATGAKGKAAPAAGRAAAAVAAAPPPPPPPQAAAPDDPRPFEDELKQREALHGPNHVEVAESCSNLATLYNQRGDARAMPLYERALNIYETNYGPEHPEVAHTLTDLAVLHLEQGNNSVGRPLLERALAIQEKALGPDHPDVLAIKDVLNSE